MKNKLLIVLLSSLLSSQVSAGVPVIEETSVIFQPLQYMEMLQTQLNTINQYEQMILDYENQIRQLENLIKNTRFDNIQITSLQDLQNTLNQLRSRYSGAIEQYNSFANRTNKIMDDGCDFLNRYELCSKEQKEQLQALDTEIDKSNEKNAKDNNPNIKGTTAYRIEKDQDKLNNFMNKISLKQDSGANQILSDTRELNRKQIDQILELRRQSLEIKSNQVAYFNYQKKKDIKAQQVIEKRFKSEKATAWKTNKIYKDKF